MPAREEFERLFEQAAGRLLLFVELRLGAALRERVEAQDVLQEAFLNGFAAFGAEAPRDARGFAAWMCRIVETTLLGLHDHFAARKRTPPGEVARITAILDSARARGTGPMTAAGRADEHERLRQALGALPDEQREPILHRFFADLDVEAIATRMGRSPSAVRRLLAKATARLGADLLREGGGP